MKNRLVVLLICVLVIMCSLCCFSCQKEQLPTNDSQGENNSGINNPSNESEDNNNLIDDNNNENNSNNQEDNKQEEPFKLLEENFTINITNFSINCIINVQKGVHTYKATVQATYAPTVDLSDPVIREVGENGSQVLLILKNYKNYQSVYVTFTALAADGTVLDVLVKEIEYTKKEENLVIDVEDQNGIVEGIEDSTYYYAKYNEVVTYTKSTPYDLAILLSPCDVVNSLSMPFMEEDDWYVDQNKHVLVIKKSYLDAFSFGAKIHVNLSINNCDVEFYINITNGLPLQLSKSTINYNKSSIEKANVFVLSTQNQYTYISAVTIDGKRVDKSFYYTNKNEVVFINSKLDSLSTGSHEARLYFYKDSTELGYSIVQINIDDKGFIPYNAKIDFDSKYPNVFITWESNLDYDKATIQIDAQRYSTKDPAYVSLFENNSFNAYNLLTNRGQLVTITLEKDGKTYTSSEQLVMSENLANENIKKHLNQKFDFIGKTYNTYISDFEELKEFSAYNAVNYSDSDIFREEAIDLPETYTIYAPFLANLTTSEIKSIIQDSYAAFVEPISLSIKSDEITIVNNEITYTVHQYSGGTRPYSRNAVYNNGETYSYAEYPNVKLDYYKPGESTRSESFEAFKVNNIEEIAIVKTSVELYLALERGYKPICIANTNAYDVYNKAKEVLREIVDDRMDDYEKVKAIYDWISYNTLYDRGLTAEIGKYLVSSMKYIALFKSTSYFAEGVFNYGVAQCNGIAAAFSILCNIEGIKCIKVVGSVPSGKHAWNKVYIDGEWYILDPTWSNAKLQIEERLFEIITYDYYLISEREATSAKRIEYSNQYAYNYYCGDGQYNYWASQLFLYEGLIYDHIIANRNEFDIFIKYYTNMDEDAAIKSGETLQVSIKTTEFLAKEWLNLAIADNAYDTTQFDIFIFKRGSDTIGSSAVEETVYVRFVRK